MVDEFGDGQRDDSFFMDWLFDEDDERQEQGISIKDKSKLDEIWSDLNKAFKNQNKGQFGVSKRNLHKKKKQGMYPYP